MKTHKGDTEFLACLILLMFFIALIYGVVKKTSEYLSKNYVLFQSPIVLRLPFEVLPKNIITSDPTVTLEEARFNWFIEQITSGVTTENGGVCQQSKVASESGSKHTQETSPNPLKTTEGKKSVSFSLENKNPVVVSQIKSLWKEKAEVALAVFQAESGLRPEAMGYNCTYGVCRPSDREKAISVDCGVGQINVKGNKCPEHLLDPIKNLEISYKDYFLKRGWTPWYAYTKGAYLQFL